MDSVQMARGALAAALPAWLLVVIVVLLTGVVIVRLRRK
ncbi:hypothetical protein SAMN05216532_0500 [Streptomyces sp. 2231.1]|nr:hypothetical protein SAMN05216532_0500 [Streptomyces sp. 2231.1]